MSLVLSTPRGASVSFHTGKFIGHYQGQKVLVKFSEIARSPEEGGLRRDVWDVEKTVIRVLHGLAVPTIVELPKATLRQIAASPPGHFMVEKFLEGGAPGAIPLSLPEAVGLWIFCIEQLVAFRRHQILYTDVRPQNIIVAKHPLTATFVDFGSAILASPRGKYPAGHLSVSGSHMAPEHYYLPRLTERSLVYPAGLLLTTFVDPMVMNETLLGPSGLSKVTKKLERAGLKKLTRLMKSCLAKLPEERPKDYEVLWERLAGILDTEIPATATKAWQVLRAPYKAKLAAAGL